MDLSAIVKNGPVGFTPCERPYGHDYRYFVEGKGAVLGVLFQDSTHIYFEWLMQNGSVVRYRPAVRYKAWRRETFADLMAAGVWQPSCYADSVN
jgi:hypothetical protein